MQLRGVSEFGSPYLHNVGMLTTKLIYILKALEKGFQNMYGLGGQCHLLKKVWPAHGK